MREGRPSFTAACVAFARGIAEVDDVAKDLLPPGFSMALRVSTPLSSARTSAWNAATLGLVDHMDRRTRAIDEAVIAGVAHGAKQLVILGAGLDARAFRMPVLEDTIVFEIDHPATQSYKRARVATMTARAREVRYVAVDFEKDALDARLGEHGHRTDAPTFWIWEGVTPYLPPPAIADTLRRIAALSSAGSRVAVTYGTPEGTAFGAPLMAVARLAFRAIGEPLRGLMTPEAMAQALENVGFGVLEDTAAADWHRTPGASRSRWVQVRERLAVAERQISPAPAH